MGLTRRGLDHKIIASYVNVNNIYIQKRCFMRTSVGAQEACQPKLWWGVLLLLTTWISWPVAVALFILLLWTGRLEDWRRAGLSLWQDAIGWSQPGARSSPGAGGNQAFSQYRSDTLRRLEEEEREFRGFLTRLRAAKDKAEFDQFMAERRSQSNSPNPTTLTAEP